MECVCTGRPVAQAPVGAHQSEVSSVGTGGGWKRKWRGWDGEKKWQWCLRYDSGDILAVENKWVGWGRLCSLIMEDEWWWLGAEEDY